MNIGNGADYKEMINKGSVTDESAYIKIVDILGRKRAWLKLTGLSWLQRQGNYDLLVKMTNDYAILGRKPDLIEDI